MKNKMDYDEIKEKIYGFLTKKTDLVVKDQYFLLKDMSEEMFDASVSEITGPMDDGEEEDEFSFDDENDDELDEDEEEAVLEIPKKIVKVNTKPPFVNAAPPKIKKQKVEVAKSIEELENEL